MLFRLAHQLPEQPGSSRVGFAGGAVKTQPTGFPQSEIQRREPALVFQIGLCSVVGKELHHVIIALQRGAVERRLAARVYRIDIHAVFQAEPDSLDRIGFRLVPPGGIFLFSAKAGGGH